MDEEKKKTTAKKKINNTKKSTGTKKKTNRGEAPCQIFDQLNFKTLYLFTGRGIDFVFCFIWIEILILVM